MASADFCEHDAELPPVAPPWNLSGTVSLSTGNSPQGLSRPLNCKRSELAQVARVFVAWSPGPCSQPRAGGPCYIWLRPTTNLTVGLTNTLAGFLPTVRRLPATNLRSVPAFA